MPALQRLARDVVGLVSAISAAVVLFASGTSAQGGCRPIDGLAPLLRPGAVLWLGEIHGAEEPPVFTREVACAGAAAGLEVSVALEIPVAENTRVQAFLDSRGLPDDVRALLDGAFWQRAYQDGRSSRARVTLLDGLRRLRAEGRKIRVVLIDPGELPAAARDRQMAERLGAAVDAAPQAVHVALLGNIHTSLDRGTPWNAEFEPAAFLVARMHPSLKQVALDLAHTGGSAWTCTSADVSGCAVRELKGNPAARTSAITLHTDGRRRGHDGSYGVGALTVSPPVLQTLLLPQLAPPFHTPWYRKATRVVAMPEGHRLTVPSGFTVNLFADNLQFARFMALAPNGDVFLSEPLRGAGRITVLRDADKDGTAEVRETFATGLNRPFGLAFWQGRFANRPYYLYVGNNDSVVRFTYKAGQTAADGPPETIVDLPPSDAALDQDTANRLHIDLNQTRGYNHWTRNVVFNPDGTKMYVTVGSSTNATPEGDRRRAAINEYNPDGTAHRV